MTIQEDIMKFAEFLHESIGGIPTPTRDLRVDRPANYDYEHEMNLLHQLQNPENAKAIAQALSEHPELAKKLQSMVQDALMRHSDIDYYRMSGDTYQNIRADAGNKAASMVQKFAQ